MYALLTPEQDKLMSRSLLYVRNGGDSASQIKLMSKLTDNENNYSNTKQDRLKHSVKPGVL